MSNAWLDAQQVRRAFGRAASSYERHDALQREVEARLFENLDYYEGKPARVLDVGSGTGRGTAALSKRWRRAEVIALDISPAMLRRSRRNAGWWHPFARVCADARAVPLPDHSVDVVYSNLCMQWCDQPRGLFRELARVLRPGGFLAMSSLGPDTLHELRAAWAEADPMHAHVSRFLDMHDIGDAALSAGLKDPVLDADHIMLEYADVAALLAELKGLGATNADVTRTRALTGKMRFKAMLDAYETRRHGGRIPATWEAITLHAWGQPEDAMPLYGGRETRFEVVQWAESTAPRR